MYKFLFQCRNFIKADPAKELTLDIRYGWGVNVVVVYQCSTSNVMVTGDIEALFVLVDAVLDC